MKWMHKFPSIKDASHAIQEVPPITPKLQRSKWVLEIGRTAVFYNGHPEFDIVAGARGKVLAKYYGPNRSWSEMMLDDIFTSHTGPTYRGLLVQVGKHILEVNETLVRIVQPVKRKRK